MVQDPAMDYDGKCVPIVIPGPPSRHSCWPAEVAVAMERGVLSSGFQPI